MDNYDQLATALNELNMRYPRPGLDPLELTPILNIAANPDASWPGNEHAGIYVIMDERKDLLYIGKASFGSTIGRRLNQRFNAKWMPVTQESEGCRFLTTIPLPRGHEFEAPAIEEFFLKRLTTKNNKIT